MLAPLLAAALLAQSPSDGAAILFSGRAAVAPGRAAELVADVETVLRQKHFPIALGAREAEAKLGDLPECGAKNECAAERGRTLGVRSVVSISAATVLSDLALHLELVFSESGEVLAQDDVIVPVGSRAAALIGPMSGFVDAAAKALARRSEAMAEPVAHAETPPPAVGVEPAPGPRTPEVVAEATPSPGRPLWVWAPGVAGVALIGVSAYFFAQAQSAADQLYSLRPPDIGSAQAVENQGVQNRTVGLVTAGVGVAAVATSVLLFELEGPADSHLALGPSGSGWAFSVSGRFP